MWDDVRPVSMWDSWSGTSQAAGKQTSWEYLVNTCFFVVGSISENRPGKTVELGSFGMCHLVLSYLNFNDWIQKDAPLYLVHLVTIVKAFIMLSSFKCWDLSGFTVYDQNVCPKCAHKFDISNIWRRCRNLILAVWTYNGKVAVWEISSPSPLGSFHLHPSAKKEGEIFRAMIRFYPTNLFMPFVREIQENIELSNQFPL